MVAARLERYICGRAGDGLFGRPKGCDFGMRLTGTLVPTFRNDPFALRNHATDARIGMGRFETPLSERQRSRHRKSIEFTKHHVTASVGPCVGDAPKDNSSPFGRL